MGRVEVVVGIAVAVLWVYSIVSCVLTPEPAVRGIPKAAWLVVIVLLPLIGSVLWLGVGRTPGPRLPEPRPAASSPRGYSSLASDERIRRMGEDLRRLEQEDRPDDQEPSPGRA